MRWIITKDYISTEPGDRNQAELRRRSTSTPEDIDPETLPTKFKLYDDDGELYYEGRCDDLDDVDEEEAFEPLNWAMADSGCTKMLIKERGKWVQL